MLLTSCRLKHNGHSNAVHLNDVFFAVHAALLAGITLFQCFIYERGDQRVSKLCAAAIGFTVTASSVSFCLVIFDGRKYPFITFLYWLSWVKMGVTFFKYMPQVSHLATFCWSLFSKVRIGSPGVVYLTKFSIWSSAVVSSTKVRIWSPGVSCLICSLDVDPISSFADMLLFEPDLEIQRLPSRTFHEIVGDETVIGVVSMSFRFRIAIGVPSCSGAHQGFDVDAGLAELQKTVYPGVEHQPSAP